MIDKDTPDKMVEMLTILAMHDNVTWALGNGRPFYHTDGDDVETIDPELSLRAMRDDLITYVFDTSSMVFRLKLSLKGARFVLETLPGLRRVFEEYVKEEGTI